MTTITPAELAREIGVTARRIRQMEDEGVIRRLPGDVFDLDECEQAHRLLVGRNPADVAAVRNEAEALAGQVEDDLRKLARLPLAKRMAAAEAGVGPAIGKLTHLLSLLAAVAPVERRDFERHHVGLVSGNLIRSLLDALNVEIGSDDGATKK